MARADCNSLIALTAAALLCAVLAGCGQNPVRDAAVATGLGARTPEPSGFVRETRPQDPDYLPVGVRPPARATQPRDAAGRSALEEELRRTRARLDAAAGRPPTTPAH